MFALQDFVQLAKSFGIDSWTCSSVCPSAPGLGWAGLGATHRTSALGLGRARPCDICTWDRARRTSGASHPSRRQAGEIGRAVLRGRPVHLLCGFVLFQERDLESSVQRLMNERSHLKPSL